MADYNPWIQEYISISDAQAKEISANFVTGPDSISIAESITLEISTNFVLVSDSLSIAESTTREISTQFVSVNDSISIAESIEEDIIPEIVSVNNSISIAESLDLEIPILFGSVNDEISITDVKAAGGLMPLVVFDNVYIRDLFVQPIADAGVGAGSVSDTIASAQLVLASATRTAATYTSNAFKVSSTLFIRWFFDVTAEGGTSTLDIILQTSPDNSVWYDAVTADQISATGQYTTTLTEPGVYVRAKCTVAGTSFTFSVKMAKHMPVRRFKRRYARR